MNVPAFGCVEGIAKDSARPNVLSHFLELLRRVAEDGFEVVDQMCLVEVAEFEGKLSTVEAFAGAEAFDGLVETVAAGGG